MAAVFVPPSPQMSATMSGRRAPLANVPNAANSPRRGGFAASKRSHPTNSQFESGYEPPLKRQMLDKEDNVAKYSIRDSAPPPANDSKVFSRKKSNGAPSAFERKLVAVREKEKQPQQSSLKTTKNAKANGELMENIRQWRKHYRKVFPQLVFYFESVPEDIRRRFSKQVTWLGASEEKFFSKGVTHVVTSRPIPAEIESNNTTEASRDNHAPQQGINGPVDTVNPTLLDKAPLPSRGRHRIPGHDRQENSASMDILYRARRMNIKIWTLDKLQRIVTAMNDADISPTEGQTTGHSNSTTQARGRAENDLSLALRNEKLHGFADRDTFRDIIPFKGPFIYVYDMDEKTRPAILREYQDVTRRQDGAWPQFRSARIGKCPFLMDEPKREPEQEKKAVAKPKQPAAPAQEAVPKAASFKPPPPAQVDREEHVDSELSELEDHLEDAHHRTTTEARARPVSPRKRPDLIRPTTMDVSKILRQDWGREPAASGVQPSNITSAIRSQMISSTAGIPGAKAATSKEVHELKRKVLEKSNGIAPPGGAASSHMPADANVEYQSARSSISGAAKSKAQGSLVPIRENPKAQPAGENNTRASKQCMQKPNNAKKDTDQKKDAKPGYCENCREKFDDFDQHVKTRKHRKFALNPTNWTELDNLLDLLSRPFEPDRDDGPQDHEGDAF